MSMFLVGGNTVAEINHTLRLIQQEFNKGSATQAPSVANTQGAFGVIGAGSSGSSPGSFTINLTMPVEFGVVGTPASSGGTLSVSWTNEAPNTVFAGPVSGSAAVPSFRALDQADMPISVWSNRYQIPTGESLTVPKYATLLGGVGGLIVDGTLIVEGQTLIPWIG